MLPEGPRLVSGLVRRAVVHQLEKQEGPLDQRMSQIELEPLLGTLPGDQQKESEQEGTDGEVGLFTAHL